MVKKQKNVEIYVLFTLTDPNHIRYVGQTVRGYERRFYEHLNEAKRGYKKYTYNWMRAHNCQIGIKKIQDDATWSESEIYWIEHYKKQGHRLTNATKGGQGPFGYKPTKEHRRKIIKSLTGRKHTLEAKRKMSKSHLGIEFSEEHKRNIGLANTGRQYLEGTRRKISKSHMGKQMSEEAKRKMSKSHLGIELSEEHKRNIGIANTGIKHSEETKRKISETKRRKFKEKYESYMGKSTTI